jgi:hypothetical protein
MSNKEGSKKSSDQRQHERDDDGYIIIFEFSALFILFTIIVVNYHY